MDGVPASDHRIGRYRILGLLGEGGMGTVYRALDPHLGREVAIKVLKKQDDAVAVQRFFREATAASALNHPNLVTVFEASEAEQRPFIVMELVRGHVLRSLIGQPIEVATFQSLARQMAEALSVAHAAGLVHRDVKPENIMVRDDGYVKILDFGLARLDPGAHQGMTTQTASGTHVGVLVGTIKYMSPEQTKGGPVGTPSDVFSLGIVMYELATGTHPFDAETQFGVLNAILTHHPVPPSRLNAEFSGRLEALMLRMLNKDAALRPSAAEVSAALAASPTGRSLVRAALAVAPSRHSVGRVKALAELRAAFEHVGRGRGLLVCVSGEPGIGKSTLVEDFLSEVAAWSGTCRIARGRCSERLAGTEAYLPLLDALEDLLRIDDGALARLMKMVAPLWYVQIAPAVLQDSSFGRLVVEARSGTQERLKRELVTFLQEACRQQPIVLFLDDLHWVDLSTTDMIGYLTSQFASWPLLIIATYRPEELLVQKHPFLSTKRELQTRGLCREIALEFLTRKEVEEYVALRFPRHRLPAGFVDLIYAKTEGNPLFVVDVLSYLSEQRVLSREHDVWTLTRSVPDIARELPESVRGMIQRKVDVLAEADRRLLVAASVQGYEFDGAVMAKVLGIDPVDIEEQLEVIDHIHGFVRRIREQEFPDGTLTLRYRFVHVLYQNRLHASVTPARRVALSLAVGKALETFYRDKTVDIASELAVLYSAAREFSLAVDYFRTAAKRAADVFAYEEALVLGRRALDALRMLPDTPERQRRELAVLMTIGVSASASRGFSSPDVQDIYNRASALCVALGEIEPLARILYGLISSNIVRLQLEAAQAATDRVLQLARDSQDSSVAIHGTQGLGLVSYYRGDFEATIGHFRPNLASYPFDVRRSLCKTFGYDPASAAHIYVGWSLWCLGYPDQAVHEVEAGVRSAEEVAYGYSLATALCFVSVVYGWRRDWELMRAANRRLFQVAKDQGLSYFLATCDVLDGLWLAQAGQVDDGLARMRTGWENLQAIDGRTSLRRFATDLAGQMARAGQLEAGLTLLDAEIDAIRSDRFWEAELLRVKAEILLQRGLAPDAAEAQECLHRALEVSRRQRAKSFELRAAISLARVWHGQARSRDAGALLSEIYARFTEGFETVDLKEARALLTLTGTPVPPPPVPDSDRSSH